MSSKPTKPGADLRSTMQRLADAPQRTLSRVVSQLGRVNVPLLHSAPPPPEVSTRVEYVFEALSELSHRPHVASACELVCEVLYSELPSQSVVAGLYGIDTDEIHFVHARGAESDMIRGTAMPRVRCLSGAAAEHPIITTVEAAELDWIGNGPSSAVLLCPILDDTNLLGVLALADPMFAANYTSHDRELVRYVAGQLAHYIRAHRQRTRRRAPAPSSGG